MSKLFYKASIHDIQNNKCSDAEINALLNNFEATIKNTARTLARKAWFDLSDFATAKNNKIDGFCLTLEKQFTNGQEQWLGRYVNESKNLEIIGSLERD